jgi:YebC/PmpR family DNA-binding regulatory protein
MAGSEGFDTMAGHSKWAQIKRKKATIDSRRGKLWTKLLKEITVSARLGGGDPDANPRLRSAVQEARDANVPNDNIERAVKRGSGELEGAQYEELTYEGYGPGGVALLIEAMTDNRNRTVGELRHLLSRNGGNLGENGCVAWMFEKKGLFVVAADAVSEDRLMEVALEAGAEDVRTEEEAYEVTTPPDAYAQMTQALQGAGIPIETKALAMIPSSTVEVPSREADQVYRLLEAIEEHDDVQNVWTNADIPSEALAEAG